MFSNNYLNAHHLPLTPRYDDRGDRIVNLANEIHREVFFHFVDISFNIFLLISFIPTLLTGDGCLGLM